MKSAWKRFAVVVLLAVPLLPLSSATAADLAQKWKEALKSAGVNAPLISRTVVASDAGGDIVEYSAVLKVGSGKYDKVGIHRMVREKSPGVPIATRRGVMLVHGSASTFRTAFAPGLAATAFQKKFGIAPFLAGNNFDVWGIDLRWTSIPASETNFDYMKGWNFASHIKDLRLVAKTARAIRLLTGSGGNRLLFAGHSLGAHITYAYANEETQRPAWDRDIHAFVALDNIYKFVSPETQTLRDEAAGRYAFYKSQYDAGNYVSALAAQILPLVDLGLTAPDEPSPVIPGFTNFQTATAAFSMSYLFTAPLPAYTPWYHFSAGTFDEAAGLPTGLQFVAPTALFQLASKFPPYQALIEDVEVEALMSGAVDVPYDDHLAEITIPVMYIGAAGGFGEPGTEVLSLLGSTDKTAHIVRLLPAGFEAADFGHIDILFGNNAKPLVWQPMLNWMLAHSP